jgi:hypothetical protein
MRSIFRTSVVVGVVEIARVLYSAHYNSLLRPITMIVYSSSIK